MAKEEERVIASHAKATKVEEDVVIVPGEPEEDAPPKTSKAPRKRRGVSCCQMFRFATCSDYLLMLVAILAAVANGGAMAGFSILLGEVSEFGVWK